MRKQSGDVRTSTRLIDAVQDDEERNYLRHFLVRETNGDSEHAVPEKTESKLDPTVHELGTVSSSEGARDEETGETECPGDA